MDALNRANRLERSGHTICHLETGQPSSKAPLLALSAAQKVLSEQVLGHTEALSPTHLRERIGKYYEDWYGAVVPPQRAVIATGSSAGFALAFLALLDAGHSLALEEANVAATTGIDFDPDEGQRW